MNKLIRQTHILSMEYRYTFDCKKPSGFAGNAGPLSRRKQTTVGRLARTSLFFLFMLCSMMVSAQQVEVTLTEAGTLSEKMASDQKYSITSLKVSGPINGTDIVYLCEMAGRDAEQNSTDGQLVDLDLTDANIVEGGDCYFQSDYCICYTENDVLGDYLFYWCKLQNIKLPNSVTTIGGYAFWECSGLTSVTIGNSVTTIGGYAFGRCSSLLSVDIPNSVTSIDDDAFNGCTSLTSVTIGNSVTTIGGFAFARCPSLASVTIPNSVTSIGDGAFSRCPNLTSIIIGNSVASIGDYAFSRCSGLTSIKVEEGNAYYHVDNNCLIETVGNTLIRGCNLTSIDIPNSVKSIGVCAFDYCTSLTSITIPNSVTEIGESAFYNCSSLTSVTIPDSVTTIGEYAFWECSGLTSAIIGNSVTIIGGFAFYNCSGLTSVTIPDSVTTIGMIAFMKCSSLTSVTIGNSVADIGIGAFRDCTAIVKLVSLNTIPPTCEDDVLNDIDKQKCTLYVPKNSLEAYKEADQWKDFCNMEEIDPTGISLPGNNGGNKVVKRYNTNGRLISYPTKGLNILKMSDGTTKKVLVK